jgi:dihydropyrimidine dehydrogenase (NAD+) subunit PreT
VWRGERDLRSTLSLLSIEGANERIPEAQIEETLHLARKAHRTSMAAAHFEELRALLNTWRYVHRWVAALMVCLLILHILYALAFSGLTFDGGPA